MQNLNSIPKIILNSVLNLTSNQCNFITSEVIWQNLCSSKIRHFVLVVVYSMSSPAGRIISFAVVESTSYKGMNENLSWLLREKFSDSSYVVQIEKWRSTIEIYHGQLGVRLQKEIPSNRHRRNVRVAHADKKECRPFPVVALCQKQEIQSCHHPTYDYLSTSKNARPIRNFPSWNHSVSF